MIPPESGGDPGRQPVPMARAPRFAGLATFMRLPVVTTYETIDVALAGAPFDLVVRFQQMAPIC